MRYFIKYIKENYYALIICILWFFPVTYFGFWTAPLGTDGFSILRFPILGLLFFFLLIGKINVLNWKILLFLFIAFIASALSADLAYSSVKLLVLAIVISVLSPLIRSQRSRTFREHLWETLCWSAVVITLLSILWKVTNLPGPVLYIKEGYPGITSHAMLFGPIAGIASVSLLARILAGKKYWLIFLPILCYMASFASASRAAIAATTSGVFLILMLAIKKGHLRTLIRLLFPIVLIAVIFMLIFPEEEFIGFLEADTLTRKGFLNSREGLWEARLMEFRENPILGLGVGMSESAGRFVHERGGLFGFAGTVEPGSAYLVVLSMTGVLGALSLIIVIGTELISLRKWWKFIEITRKYELVGIGSLLFVHATAEGWIFGPGSIICIFFWLWLGIVRDSSDTARLNKNQLQTWNIRL